MSDINDFVIEDGVLEKYNGSEHPAQGISNAEHFYGVPAGNHDQHPENAEQTDTASCDDRWHNGIACAAHGAGKDLDRNENGIPQDDADHHLGTDADHLRIGGEDPQQRLPEDEFQNAQDAQHGHAQTHADPHTAANTVVLLGAEILSHKGGDRHAQRTGDLPSPRIGLAVGCPCGNGSLAKGIDRRLDQHIGDGEQRTLHTGRKTDPHHFGKLLLVNAHLSQIQMTHIPALNQSPDNQSSGNALGNGSCQGNTGYVHMEHRDKYYVQYYVDDTGKTQINQRTFGITGSPENGGAEVIDHGKSDACKIDLHVDGRQRQHGFRGAHPAQEGFRAGHTDDGQYDTTD